MAAAAAAFAERWCGRGYEKGESQSFWIDLLSNVFGIETPTNGYIRFEDHQMVDASNFIDARIPSTRVLIEQKSFGKDLRTGIRQSDGSLLNPFQQARRYVVGLPVSEHPRWIVTCNFSEFLVYDMEQPNREPEQILLENLGQEFYRLMFLVNERSEHLSKEMEVSIKAGEIVGRIYEALYEQYNDSSSEALRWLNILCVRLVFCLYSEDAGVFRHNQFHDYLSAYEVKDLRRALSDLFEVLNTPEQQRSKYLQEDLKAFPYTNGGLFEEKIEIPQFTEQLKQILLRNASHYFDWSEISPTIFGAVFESTLNPETRRSGGMHYTSIENIHKVIDPLFLNNLRHELDNILEERAEKQRKRLLGEFQMKLSSLTFLDPACGSGNFLTETYLSLRRLENEVIREMYHGQSFIGFEEVNPIKVSIQQFYGIEINDFAVTVATTALWISESQMLAETERIIRRDIDFLPLKSYTNIREGNALRMDWDVIEVKTDISTIHAKNVHLIVEPEPMVGEPDMLYQEVNVATQHFDGTSKPSNIQRYQVYYDYIMGNPPFVGYTLQTEQQKSDLALVCKESGKNIDYVSGWYYKAARLVSKSKTCAALVSTNSITQGEQVAAIWKPLFEKYHIHIDFAYRTFRWDSEATLKAHVHCVIIGFSGKQNSITPSRFIYDKDSVLKADVINPYLLNAPTIFIDKRKTPLADIPKMCKGSQPTDGGNLILTPDERKRIITSSPQIAKYIHPYLGAEEFIKGKERYCLWLTGANPAEIRHSSEVTRRIQAVRDCRLASKKSATRKWADLPMLFTENRQPKGIYILIPSASSENRRYIPMGFMTAEVICSNANLMIPDATLYHFGVLESNVHMAWMRVVCGRLKSDYRYSNDIVYNNFPWPKPTEEQKAKIKKTAQYILDARKLYPESSLADLYDELTMPVELRKAHQDNDRAVMQAYGFNIKTMTESKCVAELFRLYENLTQPYSSSMKNNKDRN